MYRLMSVTIVAAAVVLAAQSGSLTLILAGACGACGVAAVAADQAPDPGGDATRDARRASVTAG